MGQKWQIFEMIGKTSLVNNFGKELLGAKQILHHHLFFKIIMNYIFC